MPAESEYAAREQSTGAATMIDVKGSQFEREIILWGVRWYVAYSISYRQLEEMMGERGVDVDHSSLNRWVIKYTPLLEMAFRQRSDRLEPAGAWTRPTSMSKASGSICIERSTRQVTQSTSC